LLYFNLWSHNAKDFMNKEGNVAKLHCMTCPPNYKVFNICWDHIDNRWYNYNSIFKVDMIALSFDTICPKKGPHLQLLLVYFYCPNMVQMKKYYNKKWHTILVLQFVTIWMTCALPTNTNITMFLKQRSSMIANMLWALAWL
jgi:hypothetical protein